MTIIPTGFIIAHNESGLINGYGLTREGAWDNAIEWLTAVRCEVVDDGEEPEDPNGDWMFGSAMTVWPATELLIAQVQLGGGDCPWRDRNGIACTKEENEAWIKEAAERKKGWDDLREKYATKPGDAA